MPLSARQKLDNLADSLIADIMALSDEEILAEAREDGVDIEQNTREMRAIFEKAIARASCPICHMKRVRGCTACFWSQGCCNA